jgi:hypothetical protein
MRLAVTEHASCWCVRRWPGPVESCCRRSDPPNEEFGCGRTKRVLPVGRDSPVPSVVEGVLVIGSEDRQGGMGQ